MIGTILWAIIGGAIIGVLARLILPGRQNNLSCSPSRSASLLR